jgi:two-component system, NarL family, nitrate/nitrite response regulator NarL
VIADDHRLFRDGLRSTLQDAGMSVLGEAADGAQAVALTQELRPDVVVLDLNMPGVSGLEALRQIRRVSPDVQTVVLTVSVDDTDVLAALAAGACGYLLKDTPVDRLASSIRQAAEGHMLLSNEVARGLTAYVRSSTQTEAPATPAAESRSEEQAPELTPREEAVLRLIAQGADNVAIGVELSISPHTVKQHVTNIFEKLGVHSRVQAAVYAVRAGLV